MATPCFDIHALTPATCASFYAPAAMRGDGLRIVLESMASDAATWENIPQIAYALATFKWETASTFIPIHELGSFSYFDKYEPGTPLGTELGNTKPGDGFLFRGRGYVQVTGRANYVRFGCLLGENLVGNPDLALDPAVSYRIAAQGMKNGWFTGCRVRQYFADPEKPDYLNARRMINGLDHASDIARLAESFAALLAAAPLSIQAVAA